MHDALVLIVAPGSDALWSRIGELATILQRLPPRLAVVQGDAPGFDAIRRLAGVVAVSDEALPDSALQQLNAAERLFADAWAIGRKPKDARRGDGLSWDAEGFLPPDPPRRSKG